MRFLVILGFLFVCAQADTDQVRDLLQEIPVCVEELGLDLNETIVMLNQPDISEDSEEYFNFMICYYKKIGIIKDGKLDVDHLKAVTPLWLKFRYGEEVDSEKISADVLELCDHTLKHKYPVVAAIRFYNCAKSYMKGLNLNIVNDFSSECF